MRLSTIPGDAGSDTLTKLQQQGVSIKVTLDGRVEDSDRIVIADEERGEIVCVVTDAEGKVVIQNGEVMRVPRYGDVKIEIGSNDPVLVKTRAHIAMVGGLLEEFCEELRRRAAVHDASKFSEEEIGPLREIEKLVESEGPAAFGTPEYERRKGLLGPMLTHHYANNDHHPEAHGRGVAGMDLAMLVEMVCDWKSANVRDGADDQFDIIKRCDRYGIEGTLRDVLLNTSRNIGWEK